MTFPTLTAQFAAILALFLVGMSFWVSLGRHKYRVTHGDGGSEPLNRRIRAQANFVEYVPLTLLLVGLLEAGGADRTTVLALLVPLLAARILHPIGMLVPTGDKLQFPLRGVPAIATWVILATAALLLLARTLG